MTKTSGMMPRVTSMLGAWRAVGRLSTDVNPAGRCRGQLTCGLNPATAQDEGQRRASCPGPAEDQNP